MDFFRIITKPGKNKSIEVIPDFKVGKFKDLMVRGGSFYAVYNDETGFWSTDEYDLVHLVDKELDKYVEQHLSNYDGRINVRYMNSFSTNSWKEFNSYVKNLPDCWHQLDSNVIFSDTKVEKNDYASKKLPYSISNAPCRSWDELVGTLYSEEEKEKIEYFIGALLTGDSKSLQKFLVFFGDPGTGKSTVLHIIQKLLDGYCITFDSKSLGTSSNVFATEVFKPNALLAIQHDGDLSHIDDNTRINTIVSHEEMLINEKFKSAYAVKLNTFLIMASNKPVKITDAKAGIIRRLVDIHPTGKKFEFNHYNDLLNGIDYELGSIAGKCINVYKSLGKSYYNNYIPMEMLYKTNAFFNFVESYYFIFKEDDCCTLKQAYIMYKEYCKETNNEQHVLQQYIFREELKNYFHEFYNEYRMDDGTHARSVYKGFLYEKFSKSEDRDEVVEEKDSWIYLKDQDSLLDDILKDCPAQLATKKETPSCKWVDVTTKLNDIDTRKLHYVKVPNNHIVIDFDIRDESGNKCLKKNIEAASRWPKTYVETSKSGEGLHLHYIYDGDVTTLSRLAADDIEIKVFTGGASLRRKVVKCNDIPVSTISSGLPQREVKKLVNENVIKDQKHLRSLIIKALKKQIGSGHTKPSIDFIAKTLDDAYNSGIVYDLTDMRQDILLFAFGSSNQSEYCVKVVNTMKFKSDGEIEGKPDEDKPIGFFDIEIYPNLFLFCYKKRGKENKVHKLFNPKPIEVEKVFKSLNLIGFNNRRYDNHLCYAAINGYNNTQLYNLSQKIINGSNDAFFGEAYNLAYGDIYELSSEKKSLKRFEVDLGINHKEMEEDWNAPLPEDKWEEAGDYCGNDVMATEDVFEDRIEDFTARQILAAISGLSVSDTTRMHAQKIIFGDDRHPELTYVDLSKEFPGYEFKDGHSSYRGEDPGEGGYVYAEPGMYVDAALLDIASMHPSTAIALKYFGEYTQNFADLKQARICIKHKDYDGLSNLLGGKLVPFISDDDASMKKLSYSLKIVINMVYGFTTALFENAFKDPRNVDNIIAKRGALFMINLKHEVQERGYTVIHIKTDSIKIANADEKIIEFVMNYGKKYGYDFEHEATYEKICLVNDAVYIAKDKKDGHWTATGKEFQVPYVFKKCFSKEEIEFNDFTEVKQVSTALYLKYDDDYKFIGKVGRFCPMKEHGGQLLRKSNDKFDAATGSKGYLWAEADVVKANKYEKYIDMSYFDKLANDAIDHINQFGDYYWFISDDYDADEVPFSGSHIVN